MGIFNKLFGRKKKTSIDKEPIKENFITTNELLDDDLFWEIIKYSKDNSKGDYEKQQSELTKSLSKIEVEDVMKFNNRFHLYKEQAYTWKLWGAIYLIQGGCGDDSFNDFREWVIGQGKEFFYKTVKDPESLVEMDEDEILIQWEGLGYVPRAVFEKLTGQEMPYVEYKNNDGSGEPRGEEWEEEDLKKIFPKLFEKYPDNV